MLGPRRKAAGAGPLEHERAKAAGADRAALTLADNAEQKAFEQLGTCLRKYDSTKADAEDQDAYEAMQHGDLV